MKSTHNFFILLICIALFAACSKDPAPEPIPQSVQNLIGMGNKSWHLQELYINTVSQVLTTQQKSFVKIYTLDDGKTDSGKMTSSDGQIAKWIFVPLSTLTEVYNNILPQPTIQLVYDIYELSDKRLDYSYRANNKVMREVYYAN